MVVPSSRTRERILRHGLDLVSTSGLSGVTLGILAEQVGLSKSGLFAHFGSKEELQLGLLDEMARLADQTVVAPSMQEPEGLPRLRALVERWFGWTTRAGLQGGCPVAAGMFELDDQVGPVRERLLVMEGHWRSLLSALTARAVELGHLRPGLDVGQFVWELCGIYLGHHASTRFLHDPQAEKRAAYAFEALLQRALPGGAS